MYKELPADGEDTMKSIFRTLFLALILSTQVVTAQTRQTLPSGPYKDSCSECVKKDFLLSCLCKANDGSQHESELDLERCLGDIVNNNGVLTCLKNNDKGVCREKWGLLNKDTWLTIAYTEVGAAIVVLCIGIAVYIKRCKNLEKEY